MRNLEGERAGRGGEKVKMEKKKNLRHFRDLEVYKRSFDFVTNLLTF